MNELISLTSLIFILGCFIIKGKSQDFGYEGTSGPEYWGTNFSHCVGKHQSPIDIEEVDVEIVDMLPMQYINFDENVTLSVKNNGHTVEFMIDPTTTYMPTITGGPLIGLFTFAQFHFHWGATDDVGSETKINNNSFPLEMHLVFYSSSYGSLEAAADHPDGLAVLAVLFSKAEEINTHFVVVKDVLQDVIEVNSQRVIPSLVLSQLLTLDKSVFFTYGGSLTTPPCTEAVTWIEYKDTMKLSHEQVEAFRHLHSHNGGIHNYRSPQPLHGRVIRTNRDVVVQNNSRQNSANFCILLNLIVSGLALCLNIRNTI